MTLVELMMAISISTVVIGAAAMALIVAFRTMGGTADSFAESNDAELIAVYFVPDAQSATTVGQTLDTGCSYEGPDDVIRMQGPGFSVGYRLEDGVLTRWICQATGSRTHIVGRHLHDVIPWSAGGHQVALTIVAHSGHTFSLIGTQRTGTVDLPPPSTDNQPPVAQIQVSCDHLVCTIDGTGSTDSDGVITAYTWDLGDATTSTSPQLTHTYPTAGSYTVRLTVTDNLGATHTTTTVVSMGANQPPTAAFTASCGTRVCNVDGTTSVDPDGAITAFAWSWGDGTPDGSGSTATHTYALPGIKTITLTVTDSGGATASVTRTVLPNAAPTASFTVDSCNVAVCAVDASTSTDLDGTIASYTWAWDDTTADGTGVTATHPYFILGTRTITLTVTDDMGATASTTMTVTPPVLLVAVKATSPYSATLTWTPASLSGTLDIYRNGSVIASGTANDGLHVRSNTAKGQVSGSYKVCETTGLRRCTNSVAVTL